MWSKHPNYALVSVSVNWHMRGYIFTNWYPPTQLLCLHRGSGRKHWTSLVALLASFDSQHHYYYYTVNI